MSRYRLSDNEAKRLLRRWPVRPTNLMPGGPWLRAQPPDRRTTGPTLRKAGSGEFTSRTQPDGLWIALSSHSLGRSPDSAAVFAVEVCGNTQNLADKRSRYAPATSALLVEVQFGWLYEEVQIQHGAKRPRWVLSGAFREAPREEDIWLPVSTLRVLYAVPNEVHRGRRNF